MTSFGKYKLWSGFKAAALAHARLLPLFRLSVCVFSLLSLSLPNHDMSTFFLLVSEDNTKKNPTHLKRSAPSTYIPTFQLFPHPLLKTRSTRIDPADFLEIPEMSSACLCVCLCVAGWWWRTRACCTWSPTRGPSPLSCCWIKSSASRWTPKRRRPNTESGSTASPGESRSRSSLFASKCWRNKVVCPFFTCLKRHFKELHPDMIWMQLWAGLIQANK